MLTRALANQPYKVQVRILQLGYTNLKTLGTVGTFHAAALHHSALVSSCCIAPCNAFRRFV